MTPAPFTPPIRNMWYPVCRADRLGQTPLGVRRLSEDIVIWRDAAGLRAHEDRCPHRGAQLSVGKVVDGGLRCAYHGWIFAANGQCTSIPTSRTANERLAPRLCLRSYPIQERAGLLWIYFGESGAIPPLVIPEELESPEWSGFICEREWNVNWVLVLENLADPMHGPFLHGQSLTLSRGALEDEMRTVDTECGFIVERIGQRGVNFDWSEFFLKDTAWVRLDIPLPWGPKGTLRILCFATPVDDNRCLAYFLRYRKLSGFKRAYWRFLYRNFWEAQHARVLEQDRVILESQRGLRSRESEHLANSDRGVSELRLRLRDITRQRSAAIAPH